MDLLPRARAVARDLLADELPRRWRHVQAVAAKAGSVGDDVAVAAGWLHDIGYASSLVRTGFHPLDGARWLRGQGFDGRLVALVAHHTAAHVEAELRGLAIGYPREESPTADALWYADLTTGPDGQDLDVLDRLAEIRTRYGPDHIVTAFVDRAGDELVEVVRRVESRLADRRAGSYGC